MRVGKRERHRNLAIVLLAELAAILARNPDRVPTVLWEAGIVDNPRFNRSMPLDLRQYQLAHLG
jgi:hypothetical protein